MNNTKICAQCGEEIPFGTPYYTVGDNYLQVNYFDSANDNIFCSQKCLCEALSVIEMPNDGSKTLSEELGFVSGNDPDVLEINAVVYPEDAEVNGKREHEPLECENPDKVEYQMPGIKTEKVHCGTEWRWNVVVNIVSGKIINWPKGVTARTFYKVADQCGLTYLGKHYEDYVPDFLGIWDEGCGDYIYLEILEDGTIKDWNADACRKWLKEHIYDFD